MRVAIAGASGTGKTTLANAIAERFGLPLNPIGARSVAASMGFSNPYDVDQAGRRVEFQRRLFEQKRDWEQQHEAFVTDRTYFDNLTYSALHMAKDLASDAIAEFSTAMRRYHVVFLLMKESFQQLDDGVRVTSAPYHEFYEIILTELLAEAVDTTWGRLPLTRHALINVDFPIVKTLGSITDRNSQAISRLELFLEVGV